MATKQLSTMKANQGDINTNTFAYNWTSKVHNKYFLPSTASDH